MISRKFNENPRVLNDIGEKYINIKDVINFLLKKCWKRCYIYLILFITEKVLLKNHVYI